MVGGHWLSCVFSWIILKIWKMSDILSAPIKYSGTLIFAQKYSPTIGNWQILPFSQLFSEEYKLWERSATPRDNPLRLGNNGFLSSQQTHTIGIFMPNTILCFMMVFFTVEDVYTEMKCKYKCWVGLVVVETLLCLFRARDVLFDS